MNKYILIVCILTAVIHFIGISSLAARIVGTRTRRLASSISIFNVIILFSQFANTLQAPLLTKTVEQGIILRQHADINMFRLIIFSATCGAFLGMLAIPTVHRFMEKGVNAIYKANSIFLVVLRSLRFSTLIHFKDSITVPVKANFLQLRRIKELNISIIVLNVFVYSFSTVSVLSCLYAGYLNPQLRTTSLSLSGISSGLAAIGMLIFIEPYNAIMTDKVIDGSISDSFFRRHITYVVLARVIGTIAGQLLIIPLAHFIARVATFI